MIISLSGLARSGKNTLSKILISNYLGEKTKEISFAALLKSELRYFITAQFGVEFDTFSEDPIIKEKLRPILIAYANLRRGESKGLYFIDRAKEYISDNNNNYDHFIITDLRFATLEYDEINFCKEIGSVIHISKYNIVNGGNGEFIKEYCQPPNEFEAFNDPIIKEKADLRLDWQQWDGAGDMYESLYKQVKEPLDIFFKLQKNLNTL